MMRARLYRAILLVVLAAGAVGYMTYLAMRSSWAYYYSVDEFAAQGSEMGGARLRLAGIVKPASIRRDISGMSTAFILSGADAEIAVRHTGTVPENFAEGREVVVEGRVDETGKFQADLLLTRCESKYRARVK